MKIELEVLAYTTIKRKKPWSRLLWIGKEKESLLLLDENRVSVLYLPSGKTKRQIPKLSPLIEECLTLSSSPNGYYLVGLLKSGDIFIWYKDKDIIKTISGLSRLLPLTTLLTESCQVYSCNDGSKLLLVVGNDKYFVWKQHVPYQDSGPVLSGDWISIIVPDNIPLPTSDCLETSTNGTFYDSQICGSCCQWSVVFNHGNSVCVSTLLLRFPSPHELLSDNCPTVHIEWCCLQYNIDKINNNCEIVNSRGVYQSSYSNDGQILAIAVNQRCPAYSAMLFISPLTDTLLVSQLHGCGLKQPETRHGRNSKNCFRQYWVKDMVWTVDDLFVACILNNGSVTVLARLGEPVIIHIAGCSIDIGPNYYLPLHPLVHIQNDNGTVSDVLSRENDPMSQKYSVTSHPVLPIILFSDGFNVTAVQLPAELTFTSYMRDLILESTKHLEFLKIHGNLNLTLVNAYNFSNLQSTKNGGKIAAKTSTQDRLKKFLKNLEVTSNSLNESDVSELSLLLDEEYQYGQDVSSGKLLFGENKDHLTQLNHTLESSEDNQKVLKHFQSARSNLFSVWKLAATSTENWTSNMETIVKHAVKNIYKMFTLIINSEDVTNMLSASNSSVQNGCLVNIISMYRQLLDILQFDSLEQHLLPSTLQLTHKTIHFILNNRIINDCDPRLKTLSGCYMLLKFTEKVLNRNYIWLPQNLVEKGISPRSLLQRTDHHQPTVDTHNDQLQLPSDQLSAKRLTATWKMLYESLLEFRRDQTISEADVQQSQLLVNAIKQTLDMVEADIPSKPHHVNPGDVFSLDGQYTQALDVWLQQYRNLHGKDGFNKAAKLLHSLLYTFILRGELLMAVDFIDELVVKANSNSTINPSQARLPLMTLITTTLRSQTSKMYDEVPCIKDKGVRQVVQTMARFMALYFSNQSLYIFPPHNPQALPTIHYDTPVVNNRIIPQYPAELTQMIRNDNLSDIWTVERTLEYLLLSGLVCEATWFADKMGDWKAAFLLSVACEQHKQTAVSLYSKARKPLNLPDELKPVVILQKRLSLMLGITDTNWDSEVLDLSIEGDREKLSENIRELLTTGIMCKVEVAPWLLSILVKELKRLISKLHPQVPSDFYLPSPPLYCPQPTPSRQNSKPPSVEKEERLREKISLLIHIILSVFNGSHLSLPCMTWYTQQLLHIQHKAQQFRANTEGPCLEVPSILEQYLLHTSHLTQYKDHYSTRVTLSLFRDFTSLLWLLHGRDKLSLKLRQKEKFLNQISTPQTQNEIEDSQEKWIQEIFTTLQWAVHLLTFSYYLTDALSVYKIVLSLLIELPPSEETADILAEHFYDIENLDPEIQEKLQKILGQWEAIIVTPEDDGKSAKDQMEESNTDVRKSVTFYGASPRGKSLSTYFSKQCHSVAKVLKKKAKKYGSFEEFVFTNIDEADDIDLNIGSRQFETKQSYFEFLDTFAAVSFEKLFELERNVTRPRDLPLLGTFADAIISKELAVFSERGFQSAEKKKYSLVVLSSMRSSSRSSPAFARSESIITQRYNSNLSLDQQSPQPKSQGLFRSKSVVEGKNNKDSPVKRYHSEGAGLDVIVEDSPAKSVFSPRSQKNISQHNVSNLASKFSQSEDALYKPETDDKHSWSLDVNFGRKYRLLQLLLEWLEVWCGKTHNFSLGVYDLHPTIKIQIPAQLILLSLWLLEYKYYPDKTGMQDVGGGFIGETKLNKKKSQKKKGKESQQTQSNQPIRKSQEDGTKLSTLEEEGIRNAYQHFLDGEKNNSSISVSSLESDELNGELKHTLSIIRGTGSPTREDLSLFNHRVYPDSSPNRSIVSGRSRGQDSSSYRSTGRSRGQDSSPNRSTGRSGGQDSSPTRRTGRSRGQDSSPTRRTGRSRGQDSSPNRSTGRSRGHEDTAADRSLVKSSSTHLKNVANISRMNDRLNLSQKSLERSNKSIAERSISRKEKNSRSSHSSSPNPSRNSSLERSSILKASLTSSLERATSPRNTRLHTAINSRSLSPQLSVRTNRSQSRSPDRKGHRGHVSRRDTHQESPHFDSGFNSSIASQLQNIVRSEMRRIMEVQHKSLIAMVGAIEDPSPRSYDDGRERRQRHAIESPNSHHGSRYQSSSLHRDHSPSPQRHHQHGHHHSDRLEHSVHSDHSMNIRELEDSAYPKSEGKRHDGIYVNRALKEMKNLQNVSQQEPRTGSKQGLQGKENLGLPLLGFNGVHYIKPGDADVNYKESHVNQVNIIPKFLKVTAERDNNQQQFFLPQIPHQAWSEFHPKSTASQEPIKLLKLQESAFSNFKHISSSATILPPSATKFHQPAFQPTQANKPSTQHQTTPIPADSNLRFGIPLLHLVENHSPFIKVGQESRFGQLINPEEISANDKLLEKIDEEREEIKRQEEMKKQSIITEVNKKIQGTNKVKSKEKPKLSRKKTNDEIEEEEIEEESEDEEEEEEMNDGYVFKQGEFDRNLRIEEVLGPNVDTDTRFQYMLALRMQQERQKKKKHRKVDISTMTKEMIDAIAEPDPDIEIIRRADAWTSITKDTGCDPIHEAVLEYNKRQGDNIIPPDIYLKLGYNDSQNEERGRSYLNVVDIRSSAVFNDIPEHYQIQQIEPQPSTDTTHQDIEAEEGRLREKFHPLPVEKRYGYDELTAKLLDRNSRHGDSMYLGYIPRESMRYSKTNIIKRLRELNDQVAAIDEMSLNIERDFESSKKIIKTVEILHEANDREISQDQDEDILSQSPQPGSDEKLTPKSSVKSPTASFRLTSRSKVSKSPDHPRSPQRGNVHKSDVSDISDIIGEVLLEGGVDLNEAGLTEDEAAFLKERARTRKVVSGSTSVDKLEALLHQTDSTTDEHEKKRILRKWMADRRIKQREEYRSKLDLLREREIYPYKPAGRFDTTLTGRELENQVQERQEIRKIQEEEFMRQRVLDAEKLIGDMLVEEEPFSSRTPKQMSSYRPVYNKPSSPNKFTATRTIQKSLKKTSGIIKTAHFKTKAKEWENMKPRPMSLHSKWRADGRVPGTLSSSQKIMLFERQKEEERRRQRRQERLDKIGDRYKIDELGLEDDEFIPSVSMSEELMAYTRHVADQESREEIKSPDIPHHEYKPKSYRDIVRLQRPEVTRKEIDKKFNESYVDRLATLTPRDDTLSARTGEKSPDKGYLRSTSTPAPNKSPVKSADISGIRRVKTYTERLQEMKPTIKYSTPIVPRSSQTPRPMSERGTVMRRPKPTGPPHKPVTYVQQLQKLNKEAPKTAVKKATRIPAKTFMRSHKPIHKPQTYVEKLKSINSNAPETLKRKSFMQKTKTLKPGILREQTRSRPYSDPYHDLDGDELHSVLSSWSMDDDVKKLLYEDDSSYNGRILSPEYQVSEGISDYYEAVMNEDYMTSVDIDEITKIADGVSIESGSVMSVIDWDVIDDLIATVHD